MCGIPGSSSDLCPGQALYHLLSSQVFPVPHLVAALPLPWALRTGGLSLPLLGLSLPSAQWADHTRGVALRPEGWLLGGVARTHTSPSPGQERRSTGPPCNASWSVTICRSPGLQGWSHQPLQQSPASVGGGVHLSLQQLLQVPPPHLCNQAHPPGDSVIELSASSWAQPAFSDSQPLHRLFLLLVAPFPLHQLE